MEPKVSIIIPVYNGANYLAQAIDSALAQTYKNIEIIVVNDGSKDDGETEKVALSYGEKIRYFYKENGGVSSALNYGIKKMNGDYFSWLSHDDLYEPNKVEKQVSLIQTDNDIILCSGSLMDSDCNPIFHKTKRIDAVLSGRELFQKFMHGYALNGLGFLIPRHVFDKVGMFDETMRYLQDLDLWLRMMWYDYKFICHSDLLVLTRIHNKQQTNIASDLYFVDREKLNNKQSLLVTKTDVSEPEKLLKLYLYYFESENDEKAIEVIKKELKKNNGYSHIRIKCAYYRYNGIIKCKLRIIRDAFFAKKNMRNR